MGDAGLEVSERANVGVRPALAGILENKSIGGPEFKASFSLS